MTGPEAAQDRQPRGKRDLEPEEMLHVIFDYTAKITNERQLDHVLLLMADMGREMVVSDRCSVWLVDPARDQLYTAVSHGLDGIRLPMNAGLVGLAVTSGEPIFIDDAYTDTAYRDALATGALATDQATGYRTRSLLVVPFRNNEGQVMGAYQAVNKLTDEGVFSRRDLEVLTMAASYAGKSLESVRLHQEIEETQKEIIITMGEIGESRSKETGNHVKRVAEYSYFLALGAGLPVEEAELLKMVSPMHDIGKVAIPDDILKKPGKLTPEEFELMKTHAEIGYSLLRSSNRRILRTAAIVAHEHHEKWNGTGYPRGLRGEEIHLYGRITALADVFDALASDRVYKKAWELDRILELFRAERGEHFDPALVDVFFQVLPQLLAIRERYQD